MAWLSKLTRRGRPHDDVEPDGQGAPKAENEDEDAPRTVNGIRAAKALLIIRQG